jgi:ABC-type multidrug transport system permease subunit
MFAGIGVLVDRHEGAQRELLAAPTPRPPLVLGNLAVALAVTGLQVAVLIAVAVVRGIHFDASAGGVAWFVGAAGLFTIGMYGIAEILASRVPKQEEYIARVPAIAILPWFLAGSLFPITALPSVLEWVARFLPLTHGLALMRYGLLGNGDGLHDIWGQHDGERRAQSGGDRGLRGRAHVRLDPRLLALGYPVSGLLRSQWWPNGSSTRPWRRPYG